MTTEVQTPTITDYVQPAAHPEFMLEGLTPEHIAKLGDEVIRLAQSPGGYGAFVARGHHLVEQGHSSEEVRGAVEAAMVPHAKEVGGYVSSNAAVLIENRAAGPRPHIDGSAYYEGGSTDMAIVQGNTTHQGETVVTTAIEQPTNTVAGSDTLPKFAQALRHETSDGIPTTGIDGEVSPKSLARSITKPGDTIFFRSGGRDMNNDPAPGTAHSFDIAPEADMRMTQPVSVRGAVNPNIPVAPALDQSDVL